MYKSKVDKIINMLANIQADATTMAEISKAGSDYAELCLQMLASSVDGLENMSRCLVLQCQRSAEDYLPPSSPLLYASA